VRFYVVSYPDSCVCIDCRDLRIPVERKRDPNHAGEYFEFFGGMQFKDGYLYKFVSLKSIDSNGIVPTFDELQKFNKPSESGVDAMGLPSALMSRRKGQFVKGDAVIVVQGDLKNLMGIVVKVDDDDVYIKPKDENLNDSLVVKESQLCKFFKTGDHVKVIAGTHEGATGMIVRADAESVIILSDSTREDIKVFTTNIVESSEVTSGLNKLGEYELHDLVLLDQSTVGLIVRVDRDGCQILKGTPDRTEVVSVKQRDIRRKIYDRNVIANDRDTNVISLKDIVRVVEGPFKGRQGPVEHINRGILFVLDRHHVENGGYLCVRARWCVALGGTRNGNSRGRERGGAIGNYNGVFSAVPNYLQSPRRAPQQYPPQQGRTFGGRPGGSRRDHSLVGTTVKIRIGPFKGYRGRVVDATDSDVRIELESQMKVVTVRRDQLSDPVGSSLYNGEGNSYRESPRYGAGSETPMHPSRTPMHPAFMTPMRDPSATPIHDGMRTPMHNRAWNPHTAINTPIRDNWDSADPSTWNAGTPTYQPGTPGGRHYEAPTPGIGWANTPGIGFGEAGTPVENTGGPSYGNPASPYLPGTPGGLPMTPATYLPGTPGGQPMTPGSGSLDPNSPASGMASLISMHASLSLVECLAVFLRDYPIIPSVYVVATCNVFTADPLNFWTTISGMGGQETETKWGLPDVAVMIRRGGEDSQVGVIREAMLVSEASNFTGISICSCFSNPKHLDLLEPLMRLVTDFSRLT
jgi:transcription elongation factor SPT5